MSCIVPSSQYPVELSAPDISAFKNGNSGIDYIWCFDSGKPGPHAFVTAVVHGNEICGAIALEWLLSSEFRPSAGRVSFGFMNVCAFENFDPTNPTASRFVEEDFNRVWAKDTLNSDRSSIELNRAREVRPFLDTVDYLLDIHSMSKPAPPVMLCGEHEKGRTLATKLGVPKQLVADFGHAAGKRMRDYNDFGAPHSHKTALLIECGQHWQLESVRLAKQTLVRFLTSLELVDKGTQETLFCDYNVTTDQVFYRVTEAITVTNAPFEFSKPYIGGELIPEAGTIIGKDGNQEVVTPFNDCLLVMPAHRALPGQTAVRLAKREP